MRKREINTMTWQEYNDVFRERVVILPVGSLEQHGPHLPLGVDVTIASQMSLRLSEEIDGLVLPAVTYGYKSQPASGGGPLFPGTTSLNGSTMTAVIQDILEDILRQGAKKILVLNGHFENEPFIVEAVDLAVKRYQEVKVLVASWWDQISETLLAEIFNEVPFPGWALEHAAITETSLMQLFSPDLVRLENIDEEKFVPPTYHIYPVPMGLVPASGLLSTVKSSSAQKGKMIVDEVISRLKEVVTREWGE